jgi:membrane fusion protein, multidrug efflux system
VLIPRFSLQVISLAGLCAAAFLMTSCQQKGVRAAGMGMPAVAVRAVSATTRDVPLIVSAIGNVEAIATVDVKSRIAGQVTRVAFEEGMDVQSGQLLFELDREPFLRQIAELEANLARDSAQEKQALANVAKDQAQLTSDKAKADRALQLAKEGIFSKEQTETVVSAAESSQAMLDADRAAVESARAAQKADEAKLAETKLQLSYTRVVAPMSGRAGAIAVKAGNLVKDNDTTLVTLLQTTPFYVSFAVPEQILPSVRKYNAAKPLEVIATAADSSTVKGLLTFIDNAVDTTTGTIKLKASFNNTERKLWPGQFVNITAQLEMQPNRIVVPSRTLQSGPQGKYVWVVNGDNTVAMRLVNAERTYSLDGMDQTVIGKGLAAGEQVISEGQMLLMPGAHVRVLDGKKASGAASAAAGTDDAVGTSGE